MGDNGRILYTAHVLSAFISMYTNNKYPGTFMHYLPYIYPYFSLPYVLMKVPLNLSQETAHGAEKLWSMMTGNLSTLVNYSGKCTFFGGKGGSRVVT